MTRINVVLLSNFVIAVLEIERLLVSIIVNLIDYHLLFLLRRPPSPKMNLLELVFKNRILQHEKFNDRTKKEFHVKN